MPEKKYSQQLTEYTNQGLSEDEKNIYDVFMKELRDKHDLKDLKDMMLLDTTMHDFIRIKRLQKVIKEKGDTYMWENRQGTNTVRINEASKLLLQLENQFRNNMKELLLTKKSSMIQQMKSGEKTFSDYINSAKEVKGKVIEDKTIDTDNDTEIIK